MVGRTRLALISAAAASILASCGDDGDRRSVTTPTRTQPPAAPSTAPQRAPAQPAAPAQRGERERSGGTGAPSGGSDGRTAQQAQRDFEKYCETHPGACAD